MHNYMAGKITEMSKLKQVLQLHHSGVSNRSIASQLGLYKETVNKYIRQFKGLSIDLQKIILSWSIYLTVVLLLMWTNDLKIFLSDYLIWRKSLPVNT